MSPHVSAHPLASLKPGPPSKEAFDPYATYIRLRPHRSSGPEDVPYTPPRRETVGHISAFLLRLLT